MIKVNEVYYVWYTRISGTTPVVVVDWSETQRSSRGDLAEIWYATSTDGVKRIERGRAVAPGQKGMFDDRSVFTTNILVARVCTILSTKLSAH